MIGSSLVYGKHLEAVGHELSCRLEKLFVVREQGLGIPDHLELHPVAHPHLASEARGAHGLLGSVAARGIGEEEVSIRIDVPKERLRIAAIELHPPHRNSHHFGPALLVATNHLLRRSILAGADDEAGAQLASRDHKGI
jgi:hypothetical protein